MIILCVPCNVSMIGPNVPTVTLCCGKCGRAYEIVVREVSSPLRKVDK